MAAARDRRDHAPRIVLTLRAPAVALALAAGALLLASGCGRSGRASTDDPVPGPPIVTRPVGVGHGYRLAPRGNAAAGGSEIGGLRCLRGPLPGPIVAHLEIFARRETLVLPAGIGVVRARCRYPLRTLMPTGLIVAQRASW